MGRIEMMRGPVGDAGDRQRRAIVVEHYMLVDQHARAEAAQLADPRVRARVVLVIAGDDVGPVAGLQAREGLGVVREIADPSGDEIARDRDHVRLEAIYAVDDRLYETA